MPENSAAPVSDAMDFGETKDVSLAVRQQSEEGNAVATAILSEHQTQRRASPAARRMASARAIGGARQAAPGGK